VDLTTPRQITTLDKVLTFLSSLLMRKNSGITSSGVVLGSNITPSRSNGWKPVNPYSQPNRSSFDDPAKEQAKAMVETYFPLEYSRDLQNNPELAEADSALLLIKLEEYIQNMMDEMEELKGAIRE